MGKWEFINRGMSRGHWMENNYIRSKGTLLNQLCRIPAKDRPRSGNQTSLRGDGYKPDQIEG